jgi:hypothetical protein
MSAAFSVGHAPCQALLQALEHQGLKRRYAIKLFSAVIIYAVEKKKYLANIYYPSLIFASMAKVSQGLYSQHFIFFVIYKWPDKLERLYLVSFPAWCNVTLQSIVSYEENEVL